MNEGRDDAEADRLKDRDDSYCVVWRRRDAVNVRLTTNIALMKTAVLIANEARKDGHEVFAILPESELIARLR